MSKTDDRDPQEPQLNSDRVNNRSRRPSSKAFKEFIGSHWGPRTNPMPKLQESAPWAHKHRLAISELFKGERLVIPAGQLVRRNNDNDYRFRPHSAFAHLSGLGQDLEPDTALVLHPLTQAEMEESGETHVAYLYFKPRTSRGSEEFYADSRYGELWVGARPSLEEMEALTGIRCAHIDTLPDALAKDLGTVQIRVLRDADVAITALVETARQQAGLPYGEDSQAADDRLEEALSEIRLCKDEWEISQMRLAVDATKAGFEEMIRAIPRAIEHHRGERVIEGAFGAKAREYGNGLGYETIAANGEHGTTLHWIGNDGRVVPGDVILIDAGVEVDSLYTADITRTLPVNGRFSEAQAKVYQAVLDAADAAFERASEPGCIFGDVHDRAMEVLADRLHSWGLLPEGVSVADTLAPEGQYHRRWMVHGTCHHLGLDVHDCAQASADMYLGAKLQPGMCFTIEPGLYFRTDDMAVPEELRGIAVRIEDDILVGPDGVCERLSEHIPRTIEDVEAWMAELLG
ncbi:MAG: aminopeptidase P family protein [Actinomycetaceae bacterium]|nr:aminopeptidase P family protein [Actinomycetaceae bacterium]